MKLRFLLKTVTIFFTFMQANLSQTAQYQTPPSAITDLVLVPSFPAAALSFNSEFIILYGRPSMPTIEEVAQPELKLAGLRINSNANSVSGAAYYNSISIKYLNNNKELAIKNVPEHARIEYVGLSPDNKKIAFTHTTSEGLELWLADIQKAKAKRITKAVLNTTVGSPFIWLSDSKTILYKRTIANRPKAPNPPIVPNGPVVQENIGKTAPLRTYQDLLKNAYDESLFEYYTQAQLVQYNVDSEKSKNFGNAGMISGYSSSPAGQYVMVFSVQKPFSNLTQYDRFPFNVDIYNREGVLVKQLFKIPLAETIPKGFNAVRTGARSIQWRADQPNTLVWVEAQDEGDPTKEVPFRDQLFSLAAPFDKQPEKSISFALRFGGITWGTDSLAVCNEWWWQTRKTIVSRWQPNNPSAGKDTLFDYSYEDAYANPGSFELKTNQYGRYVLLTANNEKALYLFGQGASPQGNFPFVDEFNVSDKSKKRLWQCAAPYYESPVELLDIQKGWLITRRESVEEPPNYLLTNWKNNEVRSITDFKNPYESIKGIHKELIRYKRKDGVDLTGTLYLPKGYIKEKDGALPVVMWAYPREFKSADAAGQVTNSPYEFTRLHWGSPIFWVTQGYAILDDFGMPVIGEGTEEPNETFIEQIRMDAEAAIDTLANMGVGNRKKIAVGGHSYGAFMTANLLAHTDLFAAGIARSGAYNRTLTPFGFQSEERTIWDAPETYSKMSPFMYADKIKEPLLLIHGETDDNSGTFPIQSERFYAALKGHGATTRLVMLPSERHSYRAKESILHVLWEQHNWLEKHVKNKQ
ncbi:MAG: S9 family peptidase [Saprospiraceae bacterium]|nr:S9 family peptidase [Saprospiraceae bacterium]MBP7699083.1 S9 family peptidase [Saprospiraceae bacterium]